MRTVARFSDLLHCGVSLLNRHDISDRTKVWEEKPSHLHIDLFHRWLSISHVSQSVWHCLEIDIRWGKPIYLPINIRIHDRYGRLHIDSDELF